MTMNNGKGRFVKIVKSIEMPTTPPSTNLFGSRKDFKPNVAVTPASNKKIKRRISRKMGLSE